MNEFFSQQWASKNTQHYLEVLDERVEINGIFHLAYAKTCDEIENKVSSSRLSIFFFSEIPISNS